MSKYRHGVEELTEEQVERVAWIVGPASAAAQALADARIRRTRGETVKFYRAGRTIIVEGAPSPPAPDGVE